MKASEQPDYRIRGKIYQIDLGERAGKWTYFIAIGEQNPGMTYHSDEAFAYKRDAFKAMEERAQVCMDVVKSQHPEALFSVKAWEKPSA